MPAEDALLAGTGVAILALSAYLQSGAAAKRRWLRMLTDTNPTSVSHPHPTTCLLTSAHDGVRETHMILMRMRHCTHMNGIHKNASLRTSAPFYSTFMHAITGRGSVGAAGANGG